MKLAPLLLGVSLAANAVLVVVLARNSLATTAAMEEHGAGEAMWRNENANTTLNARPALRAEAGDLTETALVKWSTIDRTDLNGLVARLKAAGYPPAAIRGIVMARLQNQLDARCKQLMEGLQEPA